MQIGCLLLKYNKIIKNNRFDSCISRGKLFTVTFFLVLSFCFVNHDALAEQGSSTDADSEIISDASKELENYRLSLPLHSPRRFATRFLKSERLFQLRVYPARSEEFKQAQYFDTRFIKRSMIEEKNSEVTLTFQLKDLRVSWIVTTKENPWRIIVDFWNSDVTKRLSLEEQWNWLSENSYVAPSFSENFTRKNPAKFLEKNSLIDEKTEVVVTEENIQELERQNPVSNSNTAITENLDLFLPIFVSKNKNKQEILSLERDLGNKTGADGEYVAAENLAAELFAQGQFDDALRIYRKLPVISERRFLEGEKTLINAGESAYLSRKFDSANDYFRTFNYKFPKSPLSYWARLRLIDLELIEDISLKDKNDYGNKYLDKYAEIALAEDAILPIKIAASVRSTLHSVEKDINAAKKFQSNFDACVNSSLVPFDMAKNCAYIKTMVTLDTEDLVTVDNEVQKFKARFANHPKIEFFEQKVAERVEGLLNTSKSKMSFDVWMSFERNARPALLDFTLSNPSLILFRAQAYENAGETEKAVQLLGVAWQKSQDSLLRNEVASVVANLSAKQKNVRRTRLFLQRLVQSSSRKQNGLNDRSVGAIRELANSPYNNLLALEILLDEMKFGRFAERELNSLLHYTKLLKKSPSVDSIFDRILAYPIKTQAESDSVQSALLTYADDLKSLNRLSKSGDIYLAVANISKGTKRAEAAYKAGVTYARAGLFEKAKSSWELAASDINDKKYSTLANERLERLR